MKVRSLFGLALAGVLLGQGASANDVFTQGEKVLQAQKNRKPVVLRVSEDGETTLFKGDALNPADIVALKSASTEKKEEFTVANLGAIETEANEVVREDKQLSPTPAYYGNYYGGGYSCYYPVAYYWYPTYIYYTTITYYYSWRVYYGGYNWVYYY